MAGRPTDYTPELAARICRALSISTKGLKVLCAENPDFPCPDTINAWRIDREDFGVMYAKAKASQLELIAEEILDISDDSSRDDYVTAHGKVVCDNEWVNRARLRVDSRKWILSKLMPKKYGDKSQDEIKKDAALEALGRLVVEKCNLKEV